MKILAKGKSISTHCRLHSKIKYILTVIIEKEKSRATQDNTDVSRRSSVPKPRVGICSISHLYTAAILFSKMFLVLNIILLIL